MSLISELKTEGKCSPLPQDTLRRQVKYLNNVIESDHGKVKQLIRPVRGLKTVKTAYATIMGFEVKRAPRKGLAGFFNLTWNNRGQARLSPIRRLAREMADNQYIDPAVAAAIERVPGFKRR